MILWCCGAYYALHAGLKFDFKMKTEERSQDNKKKRLVCFYTYVCMYTYVAICTHMNILRTYVLGMGDSKISCYGM